MIRLYEEHRHLMKIKVAFQGNNQWYLEPSEKKNGATIRGKGTLTFRGDDQKFAKFLRKLKAKDNASDPVSMKNMTYLGMVDEIKSGRDKHIWVWNNTWFSSHQFLKMDKAIKGDSMRTINKEQTDTDVNFTQVIDKKRKAIIMEASDIIMGNGVDYYYGQQNNELKKLCELLADTINGEGWKSYSGDVSLIAKDVKNRGWPDWDEVIKLASKNIGVSEKEIREYCTDSFFEEWFFEDRDYIINEIQTDFEDFTVAGRSGGHWGVDINSVMEKVKFDKDNLMKAIDSLLNDKSILGVLEQETNWGYDDIAYVLAENWFEITENNIADLIDLKRSVNFLNELDEVIEINIKEFESPTRWADMIEINEYYFAGEEVIKNV